MATFAEDDMMEDAPRKAPVSTHPAFPFIVALWFAALLGLGSLVVPVALVEMLVVKTGISSIVSAAAPPLGFTARAMIAIAFTVLGGLAGLTIARRIGQIHGQRAISHARAPISAHEELGDEGFDGPAPRSRRRALALDAGTQSRDFDEAAPLPAVPVEAEESVEMIAEPGPAESELPEELAEPEAEAFAPPEPEPIEEVAFDDASEAVDIAEEDTFLEPYGLPVADHTFTEEPADEAAFDSAWVEPETAKPELEDLGLVQLAQRLGDSIRKRRAMIAAQAEADVPTPQFAPPPPETAAEPAPEPFGSAEPNAAAPDEAAAAMAAYFANGGIMTEEPVAFEEPAEDAWLEAEEEVQPETEEEAAAPPLAVPSFEAFEDEPTGPVTYQEPVSAAEPAPAEENTEEFGFRPLNGFVPFAFDSLDVGDDEDEDEDEEMADIAASFTLPRLKPEEEPAAPARSFDPPADFDPDERDEDVSEDDKFGSLLAPRNPFAGRTEEVVRIEDEPGDEEGLTEAAVVFPSQREKQAAESEPVEQPMRPFDPPMPVEEDEGAAPAPSPRDTEENERALREALLNLQRMSRSA
ncbi:hypothetical protein [Alteraurantiacibacter aquimixticola]|uniref:Uncharacterized protein n=1 Tax=Alteraurantiacibacter aquimixticola TaxID=2489173 RepID=A0A4T3F2W1_9SPHN|nr:hypothetical protein [Alteraurantiacibacter aquimixticola]TIX48950.1 hypothetical protein E5222_14530 [Alteraurantiacibacter aquimixticola]